MFLFEFQLGVALLLDLFLGDPRWFPHPVRIIGSLCTCCERIFRKLVKSEFLAGVVTVVTVLGMTVTCTASLLLAVAFFSLPAAKLLAIFILYTSVAARDLVVHSRKVYHHLQDAEHLGPARKAVAQIVGRDTETLGREGIVRACVETVAENMVDGVTAPLFYAICLTLFAPITGIDPLFLAVFGAIGYKAVNTMDSMFGYKKEHYLDFGKMAARLDDLVNFLPARLSGLILVPAAFFLRLDFRAAWMVFKRDRLSHASPNAGHPEAAFAGALGVQLGGESSYFGQKMVKPVIGDGKREVRESDILRSNTLMFLGSFLFLVIMCVFRVMVLLIIS
ncbi:MAG: adenosylcobinamide-phosphate synthase CbiB [Desulfocapsa sp.]|nr:adenosylcobinamide-phosphate synthase CbiB [Desulfocapsa sp.]